MSEVSTVRRGPEVCAWSERDAQALRQQLNHGTTTRGGQELLRRYRKFYGLPHGHGPRLEVLRASPQPIAVQQWCPPRPQATVLVVHGYLEHAAVHAPVIAHLLAAGAAVAAVDLPGHGLSPGARGEVEHFGNYAEALRSARGFLSQVGPPPYGVVAHSMGCAAVTELLRRHPQAFDRAVFGGPLVRFYPWRVGNWAAKHIGPWLGRVPRARRRSSSDAAFLRLVHHDDPMQVRHVPLSWHRALVTWEAGLRPQEHIETPLTVLQGDRDTIVDWRYNVSWLLRTFTAVDLHRVSGGRHDLFNERPRLRTEVLNGVSRALSLKPAATSLG